MANKNKALFTTNDKSTSIKALKIRDKSIVYWVQGRKGFGVRVSPRGKKTFIYQYKFEKKTRVFTIGTFNQEFSLGAAHKVYAEAVSQVENGIDAFAVKRDAYRARKASPTVKEFVGIFIDDYCIGKGGIDAPNLKAWHEYKRILHLDIVPAIGHIKMVDVNRQDVVAVINKVGARAPVQANRTLGVVRKMFSFAVNGHIKGEGIGNGILDNNICVGIPTYTDEKSCTRILSHEEIKELWPELPGTAAGRALKLLLLCGQRSSEVRLMSWVELSGNVWTIPAERTKTGVEQVIPLPSLAMRILESQRSITGSSTYVFEGRRWGNKGGYGDFPMGSHTILKRLKETISALNWDESCAVHDLRRTFRSGLSALKIDVAVAEKLMNHQLKGILAVYDLHDYFEEKAIALQKWSDHLEGLVYPERKKSNIYKLPNEKAV